MQRVARPLTLLLLIGVPLAAACGSSGDADPGSATGTGGSSSTTSGSVGSGGSTQVGNGGDNSGGAGLVPGDLPNPDGAPPGTPCGGDAQDPEGTAMSELCASGRCETMPGIVGPVCLGACFAEGAPCTSALDCCSTGCFGGECTDALCIVEGEDCGEDAECCSGICGPDGECEVDEPNRECRPTGEDCSSGSGSGCCHACVEDGDRFFELFGGESRCGFAPETCFAQGVACGDDADCCRGVCDQGVCRTSCSEDGDACDADSDCCSGSCDLDSGTCGTPEDCVPVSGACSDAADCCSGFCFGGFCDLVSIR